MRHLLSWGQHDATICSGTAVCVWPTLTGRAPSVNTGATVPSQVNISRSQAGTD